MQDCASNVIHSFVIITCWVILHTFSIILNSVHISSSASKKWCVLGYNKCNYNNLITLTTNPICTSLACTFCSHNASTWATARYIGCHCSCPVCVCVLFLIGNSCYWLGLHHALVTGFLTINHNIIIINNHNKLNQSFNLLLLLLIFFIYSSRPGTCHWYHGNLLHCHSKHFPAFFPLLSPRAHVVHLLAYSAIMDKL